MTRFLLALMWLLHWLPLAATLTPAASRAQEQELHRLNSEIIVLHSKGQYSEAAGLARRALDIAERTLGAEHPGITSSLNNLSVLYDAQGLYDLSVPLNKRALAIREKALGPFHPDVATSLNNLAATYRNQGLYALAEPLFKRALDILERTLGPDHPAVGASLNNLAAFYDTQGDYSQAGPIFKRSLSIWEKALGPEHPDLMIGLSGLANVYHAQGLHQQAEKLLLRAKAIGEKSFGPDHPELASTLGNLSALYLSQGQYEKAEPLSRRVLAMDEKVLGHDHPMVAASLNTLAVINIQLSRYKDAEAMLTRSLSIREAALGPDHPDVAISANNLAEIHMARNEYAKAETHVRRALVIQEKALHPAHPGIAGTLIALTELQIRQGRNLEALASARRATAIFSDRIIAGEADNSAAREAAKNRRGFRFHLMLLARNPGKEPPGQVADEAFQVAQLRQASGTAAAIAKMAARFAKGDDALATLIKRKQDASAGRLRNEEQLLAAISKLPQERRQDDEKRLRDEISRLTRELEGIDRELGGRFPDYQELTRPEPVSLARIRQLLQPGESMLMYELEDGREGFLWVVQRDREKFVPLGVLTDISRMVSTVRAQMEFDAEGNTPRVDLPMLHTLHQKLIAPAAQMLQGIGHVLVVPAGPLQSLPFSMLVASTPPPIKTAIDYRQVDWLARHHAISVLPAAGSIQAFRRFATGGKAQKPFAGFGDPLIGEAAGTTRGKRGRLDVATVYRNLAIRPGANASTPVPEAEIADVAAIRKAMRLPETADELKAMARVLDAGSDSLWLQQNATEAIVKRLDLSEYRTIAFATHGVMAGEVRGAGEPGLILTPPREGSIEDDGYLSSSEIARLKLNSDWIVLSACNTAAADGTPGAEGLSGLAKAFFYAGARSLLVSHWPVASEATVPLTTVMLKEYTANPAQGKAEAHRKAMLALIATKGHQEYAHPAFWAPFVVVGEGGAGTQGGDPLTRDK